MWKTGKNYIVKKVNGFPVPSRDVIYQTDRLKKSLVNDIPAGDGKTVNFFYSVVSHYIIPEELRGILIVWYVLASRRMGGFSTPVLVFGE
jgi:hypothetical protein